MIFDEQGSRFLTFFEGIGGGKGRARGTGRGRDWGKGGDAPPPLWCGVGGVPPVVRCVWDVFSIDFPLIFH